MSLKGKHIVLGVSGGIAAYKTPSLVRLLVQEGAEVRVVCTAHALEFVTPLSLETVSGYRVYSDMFNREGEKSTRHIHYADWGDVLLVAPATANILAKMAHGIADDALSTLYLAFHKPVVVAPAMNVHMYEHPATVANLQCLAQRGVRVMEAESGFLACGDHAKGRLPELETIVQAVEAAVLEGDAVGAAAYDSASRDLDPTLLSGKKVLVTAGPTQEPLDPVRYLTNRSSGRMGFCVADALQRAGAEVFLISGPSNLKPETPVAHWEKVQTAQEMYEVLLRWWPDMQAGIFAAAVADYRPKDVSKTKIKKETASAQAAAKTKTAATATLELVPNPDLLAYAGAHKQKGQCVVGFALETDHALAHAEEKRQRKNADMMILNTLEDKGAGFETTTNKVTFLHKDGQTEAGALESKQAVAEKIVQRLSRYMRSAAGALLICAAMLLGLTTTSSLQAQELNCTFQVVTTKIQSGDKKVFETLQDALNAFVNGQKWTSLQVGSGEKIPCNMTMEVQERDQSTGQIKAYLTVQARRPVYNASYQTNLINIIDRDLTFTYSEFDPIEFSDNNISSNLTAVVAYYSYLIIGHYLDGFGQNAGEVSFGKADNVVSLCQGLGEAGWKSNERNTRNRYWMVENYMNGSYGAIHKVLYLYHRKGLDLMYDNPTEGRAGVLQALTELKTLNDGRNNLPCKLLFMEAKSDELIAMFSGAPADERQRAVELLISLDPSNTPKYQKIVQSR